jgi:hypothetical protein
MTPLALCKLTIIGVLRAAISRMHWTKTVRMQYHLRFATTSRIFDTTCTMQAVWPFDKFDMISRMKGNTKSVIRVTWRN